MGEQHKKAFFGAKIIDASRDVMIEEGILAVGGSSITACERLSEHSKGIYMSNGYELIDCTGYSILLPFVDSHVHLDSSLISRKDIGEKARLELARKNVDLAIGNGILYLRDCGSSDFSFVGLRDEYRSKNGISLHVSGMPMTTKKGHLFYIGLISESEDELRSSVRKVAQSGCDLIKICATGGMLTPESNSRRAQYTAEELKLVVDEARKYGLNVAAHTHGTEGIQRCIEAGIASIEHCTFLGKEKGFDIREDYLAAMADKGIFFVATLTKDVYDFDQFKSDFKGSNKSEYDCLVKDYARLYSMARNSGVRFVLTTDSWGKGNEFGNFGKMIVAANKAFGMPLDEILRAVSVTPHALLGNNASSLEAGSPADFIVLGADPYKNIDALDDVRYVVRNGSVIHSKR